MHSFDAILECLCLGRSAHYDVLEEQPAGPALGFPHEKAQHPPTTQSLAEAAYYNSFGQNPGNQLYVGNVGGPAILDLSEPQSFAATLSSRMAGFEGSIHVCGQHYTRRHQYRGRWSA